MKRRSARALFHRKWGRAAGCRTCRAAEGARLPCPLSWGTGSPSTVRHPPLLLFLAPTGWGSGPTFALTRAWVVTGTLSGGETDAGHPVN